MEHPRYVYITVRNYLCQLATYLMVVEAPPKEQWEILERVMNQLMTPHPRDDRDIYALGEWTKEMAGKALHVFHDAGDNELALSTSSEEFKTVFHYYLIKTVHALHLAMAHETALDTALQHLTVAAVYLTSIHDLSEPPLKTLVRAGYAQLTTQ